MADEIDLEKCNFRNFRSPVTVTLDGVIRHTVVHHSSTSIYISNFVEIGKTFCGRTYVRTDRRFKLKSRLVTFYNIQPGTQRAPILVLERHKFVT